jgi:hypothetical protein
MHEVQRIVANVAKLAGATEKVLGNAATAGGQTLNSEEMYPIQVSCLCSLQLCDCHTSKCDSVMSVYDEHRASVAVMHLTEYLSRCVVREQSMIKRKLILICEVGDRFLTEAWIEYKSIVSCPADQSVILPRNQEIVSAPGS